MSNVEVERSIEAILMVVDEPVTELTLASVLAVTVDEVVAALENLSNASCKFLRLQGRIGTFGNNPINNAISH
jgi:chromosome segregation and condensation protein ScpB